MPGTKWKRSIKNPAQYHALRKKGFSKSSAARITNARSKGKKMRRSAKQIAASRRNLIKARAARKRHRGGRAKKVAKGVGIVALVAASGYAAHKASGSQLIISSRTPTVHHHVTGRPVGTPGFKRTGSTISYVHRNTAGDRHIVYTAHVHGQKVTTRRSMPAYKPKRTFVRPSAFKKANYPHTQEAKNVAGRKFKHSSFKSGISEAEAMRRSRSYASARGGKISYAEQNKALRKYRKQKR